MGSGKAEITITENAGAYKGNSAVWEISCKVKLVGKQSLLAKAPHLANL